MASKKPNNTCDEPGNSEDLAVSTDDPVLLSVKMRARKAMDHLSHGKCGPTDLTHTELDQWIEHARALEQAIRTRH